MNKYVGLLASAGFACVPAIAAAAGSTIDDLLTNSGITEAGHLSASYDYGFNKGKTLAYRAFDFDSDTFEFNQAWLSLTKAPTEGVGGSIILLAGSDAKVVNGSYGSGTGDFALTQAYVSWTKGNFSIIGGRFLTLAGAEVIDDSANANISRSLLFQNAEPLVHTGVRSSYKFTDTLTGYLGVSNSALAGTSLDGDKHKTGEFGLAWAPSTAFSLATYDYYGVDSTGGGDIKDNYLDVVAIWAATDKLQVVVNGDYLRVYGAGAPAGGVYVAGFAGYLNYAFNDSWKGSLRGEYAKTKNYTPGADSEGKSDLSEITATLGYSPVKSLWVLGELRYDFSGDENFPDPGTATDPTLSKDQGDVAIKAIYSF